MARWMKSVSLFMGYGLIGFTGDYAVGLLAGEPADEGAVEVDVAPPAFALAVDGSGSGACAHEVERRVRIGASAMQWLRIEAGSGGLRVEGRGGVDQVQAVGRVCASDEAYLDDLRLTLEREGDEVVLRAHYPDRSGRRGWRGEDYARIDLAVEIPLDMPVDVADGSGDMELTGTGALRIDDSSGSILVRGANGSVTIDDSSGEIELRDIAGDVEIDDGSGGIDLADIQGSVRLRDGSGSIEVVEVEGDVVVEDDGSGSISVRDVRGDFRVRSDGSGGIRYSGVGGAVDIPRDPRSRRGG